MLGSTGVRQHRDGKGKSMKLGRVIRRAGVVLATVAALVATVISPASADIRDKGGYFFGDITLHNEFYWQVRSNILPADNELGRATWGEGLLQLGRNAVVSATDCRISLWQELHRPGVGYWETPHVARNCMDTIRTRDIVHAYDTQTWETSATAARGHLCVYLYYNNKDEYGWARCVTGVWAYA
jgi:hypothetical protein